MSHVSESVDMFIARLSNVNKKTYLDSVICPKRISERRRVNKLISTPNTFFIPHQIAVREVFCLCLRFVRPCLWSFVAFESVALVFSTHAFLVCIPFIPGPESIDIRLVSVTL